MNLLSLFKINLNKRTDLMWWNRCENLWKHRSQQGWTRVNSGELNKLFSIRNLKSNQLFKWCKIKLVLKVWLNVLGCKKDDIFSNQTHVLNNVWHSGKILWTMIYSTLLDNLWRFCCLHLNLLLRAGSPRLILQLTKPSYLI